MEEKSKEFIPSSKITGDKNNKKNRPLKTPGGKKVKASIPLESNEERNIEETVFKGGNILLVM